MTYPQPRITTRPPTRQPQPIRTTTASNEYLPPCQNGGTGPRCELPRPPPKIIKDDTSINPCGNGGLGPNCDTQNGYNYDKPKNSFVY